MSLRLFFTKDPDPAREKRAANAASLGMFMPLVAYAYVGRFARGLVAAALGLIFIGAMSHLPFGLVQYRPIAVVAAISHFLVAVGFCVDANLLVRRHADRTGLWYQEFTLYVPLFLIWVAVVVAGQRINETTLVKTIQICRKSWGVEPSLWPKDCVLVAPSSRWSRGDIVLYEKEGFTRFGRVVGLPGDMVELRNGVPVINGAPFSQHPAPDPPSGSTSFEPIIPTIEVNTDGRSYVTLRRSGRLSKAEDDIAARRIPEGRLFVLADLRDGTWDSRSLGDVSLSEALGKPVMVSYSPDWSRFGLPVR